MDQLDDRNDERNLSIRRTRTLLRDQVEGPRIGDFIGMEDGTLRRFTHDWDEAGLQVTSKGMAGSFYLGKGYLEYSGGLDPIVPLAHIQEVSGEKDGACWFFDHDIKGAGRGVDTHIPCRIFKEVRL